MIRVEDEEIGMILEVKYAENGAYDSACKGALEQIKAEGYVEELKADHIHTIFKYGIACFKKRCKVVLEKETDKTV